MMKTDVMGLMIDDATKSEALDSAEKYLCGDGRAALVFTPNAEIAYACAADEKMLSLVNSAEIVLPDGEGVLKAAKMLGTPLKEKVAGVEFGYSLAGMCGQYGKSLFILGGKPGVAEKAAGYLMSEFDGLTVSGTHDGYFEKTGEESDRVIERINASGAEVLFVCLGFPAQEKWAAENRDKLTAAKLVACLGGSVDVYAGTVKRAPKLFVSLKLEWLYRLVKQPRRLGRMLVIPKYLRMVKKYRKSRDRL